MPDLWLVPPDEEAFVRPFTIPEAARELGISEYHVKKHIAAARLEVVRRAEYGAGRARLLDYEDVIDLKRQLQVHNNHRIVATIGVSDVIDTTLEIAGLRPMPCTDLLDATSVFPNNMKPLIVIGLGALAEHAAQVEVFRSTTTIIVCSDDDKLRDLVQTCWRVCEKRSSPE